MVVKIVLDAGHGINTAGKRTPAGEREWTFNNAVLKACETELRKYKDVQILRVDDPTGKTDVGLSTRATKANNFGGHVYVSFHHNASTGKWHGGGGTEVYSFNGSNANDKSSQLAKMLAPKIANAMGLRDRGAKRANFAVLRETKMPAILIEGGFMDSTVDIKAMRNDSKLKAQGVAVAKVLVDYFNLKPNSKPAAKPTPTKRSHIAVGTVKVATLNLRDKPTLSGSKVLKTLPKGSSWKLYDINSDGWVKIGNGWASNKENKYLEVKLIWD